MKPADGLWVCPICQKKFIKPRFNVYKLKFDHSIVHYCSYACYLEGKHKHEIREIRRAATKETEK